MKNSKPKKTKKTNKIKPSFLIKKDGKLQWTKSQKEAKEFFYEVPKSRHFKFDFTTDIL